MSTVPKNRAGFRLDDTRALWPIVNDTLYRVSQTLGHADDHNATEAMLRRVRVAAFWMVAAAEAALLDADPEQATLAALDAELAAIFGERGNKDAIDR